MSIIEYCNHIWVPTLTQIRKIESIQRHITKYMCLKSGNINLNFIQRLEFLDLKPLIVRKKLKVLKITFRTIYDYNDIPISWKKLLIINKTRNGILVQQIHNRINLCDNNLFAMSSKLFNSLPINIRNETKCSKFIKLSEIVLIEEFINTYKM